MYAECLKLCFLFLLIRINAAYKKFRQLQLGDGTDFKKFFWTNQTEEIFFQMFPESAYRNDILSLLFSTPTQMLQQFEKVSTENIDITRLASCHLTCHLIFTQS